MALDESIDKMEKLENNGVTAYIALDLKKALEPVGAINIDYVTRPEGGGGYTIRAGQPGDCSSSGCSGC